MVQASKILETLFQHAATADYIGEPVTQAEHAFQAAKLAAQSGDDELVLAALLHDVGHLCFPTAEKMADVGVLHHESLGCDYLISLGFSKRVAELVEGHVDAKRYLVATKPDYRKNLSEASLKTLRFQGGEMSAAEVLEFEARADFKNLLQLRAWDEAAKQESSKANTPEFSQFSRLIDEHVNQQGLSDKEHALFFQQGYLHLSERLPVTTIQRLVKAVTALEALPETPGKWMKYFEPGQLNERLLCRIENFLQYQQVLDILVQGPWMIGMLSQLMAEEAVLFKEKINFKLPGAAGFLPHQDAPAFTSFNQDYHITLMLSFDASHAANGCLEVVHGEWRNECLPMEEDKTIALGTAERLDWQPVPTRAGDLVLFGSYIPHRSGPNTTDQPRRALYATYNRLSQGNVREQYFAEKRRVFPPDVEREPGRDYGDSGVFNVGNPVAKA